VIDEHVVATTTGRGEWGPAALGCVPWLTDPEIAGRLARLRACCIVVDKERTHLASVLADADNGFPNVLSSLRYRAPREEGSGLILGPSSPMPEYTSARSARSA
jgi:hypothetical protein